MPKGKHHQNPQATEFTDYTIAGTDAGRYNAVMARNIYVHERREIQQRQLDRLDNRLWDTRQKPHPIKVRAGFPTKREPDPERIRNKGVPHSKFLERFKIVDRICYSNALGEFVNLAKIWVLHATRGWKVYA